MHHLPALSFSSSYRAVAPPSLIALVALAAFLWGCPVDFEDPEGPSIVEVTITPDEISRQNIGSPDVTFTAEISTANFDDELDPEAASVFIGEREAHANPEHAFVDDGLVVLENIGSEWFSQHHEPGEYAIGAEVASDTASARAFNQDIVTVTD